MFRTAEPPTLRLVAPAGDRSRRGAPAVRGATAAPRTFPALDELDASRPPLPEVAGAIVDAVRLLLPSATCAVVVRAGETRQCIARRGAVDVAAYHRRHLARLDLDRCDIALARRHLVTRLPSRRVRAWLLVLGPDEGALPDGVARFAHALVDDAGRRLDAALAMQRRDRALRRLEVLHAHGAGAVPARDPDELSEIVAGLWPAAVARYAPRDSIAGLDAEAARIVREACACSTTAVASSTRSGATESLLPVEHVHRLAVAVPGRGAVLVEAAAAGEPLDGETVTAAAVVARLFALAERERRVEAHCEILAGITAARDRARRFAHDDLPPVA